MHENTKSCIWLFSWIYHTGVIILWSNKMKPWGSIKPIIKQPLSQKPRNIFQKHKYLYRAMMHLHLKSYGDQYYWSYRLTRNCKGLSQQLFLQEQQEHFMSNHYFSHFKSYFIWERRLGESNMNPHLVLYIFFNTTYSLQILWLYFFNININIF